MGHFWKRERGGSGDMALSLPGSREARDAFPFRSTTTLAKLPRPIERPTAVGVKSFATPLRFAASQLLLPFDATSFDPSSYFLTCSGYFLFACADLRPISTAGSPVAGAGDVRPLTASRVAGSRRLLMIAPASPSPSHAARSTRGRRCGPAPSAAPMTALRKLSISDARASLGDRPRGGAGVRADSRWGVFCPRPRPSPAPPGRVPPHRSHRLIPVPSTLLREERSKPG
jgi:hypothetical protein